MWGWYNVEFKTYFVIIKMQNIPSYLTINGNVYYRWGSYNDNPKWRYTDGINDVSIINYQNDWVIVNEALLFEDPTSTPSVLASLAGGNYIDTTSNSFYECRCFSFSAIDVTGAGLSNVNGRYTININDVNDPNNRNNVLGKNYRVWRKGDQFIMLQASLSGLNTKVFVWTIYGANLPFKNAPAYVNAVYKPFSDHGSDVNCPPVSNWVPIPGAGAGSAPTLTLVRDPRY